MNDGRPPPSVRVILVPPDPRLIRRLREKGTEAPVTEWLFLGDRPEVAISLASVIGPSLRHGDISDEIQEMARHYRQPFVDYIGELTRDHCGIPWFIMSLSEKNPFASPFYFSLCAVAACMRHLATAAGTVLVVCGSPGIRDTLATNLCRRGYPVEVYPGGTLRSLAGAVSSWLVSAAVLGWFAARYGLRILLARIFRGPGPGAEAGSPPGPGADAGSPPVLVHAWTDERSFRDPGRFWDIFYGDLVPLLSRDGPVTYLIDILPTLPYLGALLSLRRCLTTGYLLQERFLSLSDIPRAIAAGHRAARMPVDAPPLGGMEIGPLVREERERDTLTARGPQSYLYYCAGRRLAALHPSSPYLYTFENHMWEKCTLAGIHEVSRDARVIGYAHSLVYLFNLSYSLSVHETGCTPVPDLILANGALPRDLLIRSGFPEPSVHVSGALRYEDLRQLAGVPGEKLGEAVLVAGSVSRERTLELVHKALLALGGDPEVPVWIKCHPNLPFNRLEGMLPPLPPHFSVREEPVRALFPFTGLVLFTESTVAVEAAAGGIPVIHIRLDCSLDMNVFEGLPLIPSHGTPEEIRQAVLRLRGRPAADLPRIRGFIGTLFGDVDPDRVRALVRPAPVTPAPVRVSPAGEASGESPPSLPGP